MTKDVLVTVKGIQSAGEPPVELVTPGEYYSKDGVHYLFYVESGDDAKSTTRNRIRFDSGQVDVRKEGSVSVNLLFVKDKRTVSNYNTPFGSLATAVTTTQLSLDESEDEISLLVRYALSIGGNDMEDCEVNIHISPRNLRMGAQEC
jgi:uncharacterized beta-barrel protein YwiB (DUF1934 family)